jgi:hypothetical protein
MRTTTSWARGALGALALSMLGGCGGGGGGNDVAPPPPNAAPVAAAGTDQRATRGQAVTLNGRGSTDGDGDALTYSWTQVTDPAVTGVAATLQGEAPAFTAPARVGTLVFDLVVSDGKAQSPADRVMVNVLEDAGFAIFVDGSNSAPVADQDGSQASPYATIAKALEVAAASLERIDVYVMALPGGAAYDERGATLVVPGGTSLYGGYGPGWIRDLAAHRTKVLGAARAVEFAALPEDAWLSGFDVSGATTVRGADDVAAVWVAIRDWLGIDPGTLYLEDNRLAAGDVTGLTPWTAGSSYGVMVSGVAAVEIRRNVISAGAGGDGNAGAPGAAGIWGQGYFGGLGGGGGTTAWENGRWGEAGCTSWYFIGAVCTHGGGAAGAGAGGSDNPGGNGGSPAQAPDGAAGEGGSGAVYAYPNQEGMQTPNSREAFQPGTGLQGAYGSPGYGGGGGGGGSASAWGSDGGAGGAGGRGGGEGQGGLGGSGGGASIGIWVRTAAAALVSAPRAILANNTVISGPGGAGAEGGNGGGASWGDSGQGGRPGNGDTNWGGNGGTGGWSGQGGKGGAGGGGPSYGIAVGTGTPASITDNSIAAGNGGPGGTNPPGDSPTTGHSGEGGYSFAVFDMDLADGLTPDMVGNPDPSVGLAGAAGGTDATAGAYGVRNW